MGAGVTLKIGPDDFAEFAVDADDLAWDDGDVVSGVGATGARAPKTQHRIRALEFVMTSPTADSSSAS